MQSELKQLKDAKLKLDTSTKKGNKDKSKGKGKGKNKEEQKKDSKKPDDSWKLVSPKGSGPHTKQHSGCTYYWCKNHRQGKGKWVLHKLEDCNNKPTSNSNPVVNSATTPDTNNSNSITPTPGTTFAAAAAAAAIQALNDSDSD